MVGRMIVVKAGPGTAEGVLSPAPDVRSSARGRSGDERHDRPLVNAKKFGDIAH
jgi:hypothetical protein